MINRAIINKDYDLNQFDYFNDYKDTISWLKNLSDKYISQERKDNLLEKLKKENDVFLSNLFKK